MAGSFLNPNGIGFAALIYTSFASAYREAKVLGNR